MNSNHFPDISRCKKLTEIEFPQTEMGIAINYAYSDKVPTISRWENHECVSNCPSVMEMLDVIPIDLGTGKLNDVLKIQNSFNDWSVSMGKSFHTEGTLPNALADLIFWLVENGYIKF